MSFILPELPPTRHLTNLGDLVSFVTPHFALYEFLISHSRSPYLNAVNIRSYFSSPFVDDYFINIYRMASFLEKIREEYGKPITINSGYRNHIVNSWCNGSDGSYHLLGRAVDIKWSSTLQCLVSKYKSCLTECIFNQKKGYIHIAI